MLLQAWLLMAPPDNKKRSLVSWQSRDDGSGKFLFKEKVIG